ncbi:alpha/beta fold hydrolase [Rhizobium leguminosarum]|uniref:alpha/beta fold hydrolase n=1 Tax=Rhizobium leguminosarum TaxID=384 RepID=UPI00103DC8FC|nr:alpha/beta hydrolase [Rhizobium leguminosarum]TBZ57999.1 alpha/beta hydrolase [Rhizobium leguminosarum bv. viciae]TCA82355.1 alpha/beta hydrolase [Rhizobium leguminosarum bv. viciae]TCA92818.1 alpha/beta hydrolase [Rhizobium leguminosarum bv. viciae]
MRIFATATLIVAAIAWSVVSMTEAMAANLAPGAHNSIVDGKSDVDGVNYHYLLAHGGPQTVVLLHGWGTTSYMWRYVMPELAARGYTVLAPDLRGLGDTAKPAAGYEKAAIAQDIRKLVSNLGLGPAVNLVGHDMGGMVVYAYAAQHPGEVKTLAILDVPLPGIEPWDEWVQGPRTWHFRFHALRDVPEMLIAGRELEYLKWFHNVEGVNSRAFDNEADEIYGRSYAQPGALRAGFEYYRAFPEDAVTNRAFAESKLEMPVLAMSGIGGLGSIYGGHIRHVANNVRAVVVDGAGHWIPEEQPVAVTTALTDFLPPAK